MKHAILLIIILGISGLSAQTYTDCNNQTESKAQWINAGTPLLVASKAFDCSICVSRAPSMGNWAANNQNVRVWGAMTYTYDPGGTPSCSEVANWVSNHGWQGVFTFVDANRDFFQSGTPRYYVYEPISGMEVYNGFNFNQAAQVALSYVNTVSIDEEEQASWSVSRTRNGLLIHNLRTNADYRILDITGKVVQSGSLSGGGQGEKLTIDQLHSGLYLLQIGERIEKIVLSR